VLVGLTGAGVTDMRTTALGELVPGIEIQAQVIETIVEGRFLQRPTWLKWARERLHHDVRVADHLVRAPPSFAVCGVHKSGPQGGRRRGHPSCIC